MDLGRGAGGSIVDEWKAKFGAVQSAAELVAQIAAAIERTPLVAVCALDRSGQVSFWNAACAELYGIAPEAALQQSHASLVWPLERAEEYQEALAAVWRTGQPAPARDWHVQSSSGRQCWVCAGLLPVFQYGVLQQVWRMEYDVSPRKAAEEQSRHQAEHDFLTGMPNRVLLMDRLSLALATARRKGSMLALLFLDLDHFKQINDTLGHPVGDQLLKEAAARLVRCVRGVDTVSRQGGDEFVVLLAEIGGIEQAAHVAAAILQAMEAEFVLTPHRLKLSASIGISLYPSDGIDSDTLMNHADLAMYHAKEGGRGRFQFFDSEMNARALERVGFEQDLRQALQERQLLLEFYPVVDLGSGAVLGAEARLRWRHPSLGLLAPERFLPAAEGSGLIVPLGRWALQQACQQARGWPVVRPAPAVALKLSPAQLVQKDLAAQVAAVLAAQALAPERLVLEVTEADLTRHARAARETLQALHALGVGLAIERFGSGYSRLGELKDYPVDKLKIDSVFLDGVEQDGENGRVVRALVGLGHSLGLRVQADGVQNEAQRAFLRQCGCDEYQAAQACAASGADGIEGLLAQVRT